jgi:hypothetical protein
LFGKLTLLFGEFVSQAHSLGSDAIVLGFLTQIFV